MNNYSDMEIEIIDYFLRYQIYNIMDEETYMGDEKISALMANIRLNEKCI